MFRHEHQVIEMTGRHGCRHRIESIVLPDIATKICPALCQDVVQESLRDSQAGTHTVRSSNLLLA